MSKWNIFLSWEGESGKWRKGEWRIENGKLIIENGEWRKGGKEDGGNE